MTRRRTNGLPVSCEVQSCQPRQSVSNSKYIKGVPKVSSDNGGREDADVQNARKEAICSSARATSLSGRCTLNDATRVVNECSEWCRAREGPCEWQTKTWERGGVLWRNRAFSSSLSPRSLQPLHCTNKTRSGSRTIFGFRPCHASRGRGDGMGIDPRAKLKRIRDDADSSRDTVNNNNHGGEETVS